MDVDEILSQLSEAPPQPLDVNAARRAFVFANRSGSTVIRPNDKLALSRNRDMTSLKAGLETSFQRMVTAVGSTQIKGAAVGKINQLRNELYNLIDSSTQGNAQQ